MITEKLAEHITEWTLNKSGEGKDEKVVIQYGIQLIIENAYKLILLAIISAFLGKLKEASVALLSFILLRINAGGWHAKTNAGCTVFMAIVLVSGIAGVRLSDITAGVFVILQMAGNYILWKYAPNGSQSCQILLEKDRKRKKHYAILTWNLLLVFCYFSDLRNVMLCPVVLELFTIVLAQKKDFIA